MSNLKTKEDLLKLSNTNVGVIAEYSFQTTLNGPFGTFSVTLLGDDVKSDSASGTIQINTIFLAGAQTNLVYMGEATFNGSTGYTTVKAPAQGSITVRPNPPQGIKTNVTISIAPGFHTAELSVEGFFDNVEAHATSITYIPEESLA